MLNAIIRWSLQAQFLTISIAVMLLGLGVWQMSVLPIDVFPDLNRPRVVIITEAQGLAPEEVELLVTLPIETTMNGASSVEAVRSSSGVGISIAYIEFAFGTPIHIARQTVTERLQTVQERLPTGIAPQLAPISSIMGQIVMLGMWSDEVEMDPMALRTTADWIVRQRLLTIPGVSQVFVMGGDRKQIQVLVDLDAMQRLDVSLAQIETAVAASNENANGGYLDRQGPNELLVRAIGRLQSIDELRKVPVTIRDGQPVLLQQVAQVIEGAEVKRGDSSAFTRKTPVAQPSQSSVANTPRDALTLDAKPEDLGNQSDSNAWSGGPAVVLTINKQPGADTRNVSDAIARAIEELRSSLPAGVRIEPIYSQRAFIDRAIDNVLDALRDGALLVTIILYLFLLNFRTTFITLTAIPLSLVMTSIVFAMFDLSINTMTLGGVAVAMGELVDDAIVDVENIHRRLKQNRSADNPLHPLLVVYRASTEVRKSIVVGTSIVIIVFTPLFALGGMEGKLFVPLGVAYIVSIVSSLIVSLTVTPVLSYWLLGSLTQRRKLSDGTFLAALKWLGAKLIGIGVRFPKTTVATTLFGVIISAIGLSRTERDFLPPFNEGTIQLNVLLPPGTSLTSSTAIAKAVEQSLMQIDDIRSFARRTGRAELDEHAEGVNVSEFLIELDPHSTNTREQQLAEIRQAMTGIPGIVTAVEQPLAHLMSHMISGVKAQVGIKLYGDDLDQMRQTAEAIKTKIETVSGVTDALVEPQVIIPQLRIDLDRDRLLQYGLTVASVNKTIQTAMNGRVVSQVLDGVRTFDLLVRLQDNYREDLEALQRLLIPLPEGGVAPLSALATIYESGGPNVVHRENVRRRIIIQCNIAGRGVVDVVDEIRATLDPLSSELPPGYYLEYSGQFESQARATRIIALLFLLSMFLVFLILRTTFRSTNLALQVISALPMAFIGGVAALMWTQQTLSIAAAVGFISLAGIASRNGILLLQHYLHLVQHEGESFNSSMLVRAGTERLAPVLMTALTSGIGLLPLVIYADEPGKELLYPVATVILGGLFSSTLLDFLVRPALFQLTGMRAAERVLSQQSAATELV